MKDDGLNLHKITFSAVRLVAVYVLAQATFHLPDAGRMLVGGGQLDASSWSYFVGIIFLVLSGVLLWILAERLATVISRGNGSQEAFGRGVRIEDLELSAFALFGVFLLVNAIPRLASDIAQLVAPATFDPFLGPDGRFENYRWAKALEAFGNILRITIGLWLLLGTRSFVGWLKRFRERGLEGPRSSIQYEDEQ